MKKPLQNRVALSNSRFSPRHSETTTHTPRFKQFEFLDELPERDPSILFDPDIYFTPQEIDELFRKLYETLEGGSEC